MFYIEIRTFDVSPQPMLPYHNDQHAMNFTGFSSTSLYEVQHMAFALSLLTTQAAPCFLQMMRGEMLTIWHIPVLTICSNVCSFSLERQRDRISSRLLLLSMLMHLNHATLLHYILLFFTTPCFSMLFLISIKLQWLEAHHS